MRMRGAALLLSFRRHKALEEVRNSQLGKIEQFTGIQERAVAGTAGLVPDVSLLRVDNDATVLNRDGEKIPGLYACGEMVGDVFSAGYPGGSGLTSGAVFGRIAGRSAAQA